MKNYFKSLALVSVILLPFSQNALANVVEPFTNGALSAGWSAGIGSDASTYLSSAAPDGSYGLYLVEDQWSYNSNISFNAGDTLSAWINPGPSPASDNNFQGGRLYLGFDAGASGAYSFVAASDSLQLGFENNNGYGVQDLSATNSNSQNYQDQWYYLTISLSNDGTSATANLYGADGTTLLNSLTETGLTAYGNGIALRGNGGAVVDTIAVAAVPVPGMGIAFASLVLGFLGFKRRQA